MKPARLADLDAETRARIESACAFVNHKVKEARSRVVTIGSIVGVAAVLWQIVFRPPWQWPVMSALLIISLVTGHAQREIKRWYKMLVIRRVVDALGHGLTYSHESSLTKQHFLTMDLFVQRIDKFESEDQVTGQRNHIEFALHEAKAIKVERRGKSSVDVIIFKGQVVELEFNKHFVGHTIVVPDHDSKVLGGLFGDSERRNGKQIVHIADADFENAYTVYSTNDQEAHYLLTPKLIELVLGARQRLGTDLRLAFVNNSLFVTLASETNHFEVSLFGNPATPYGAAGDLAAVVDLAEKLIDLFDLETRIWTRV